MAAREGVSSPRPDALRRSRGRRALVFLAGLQGIYIFAQRYFVEGIALSGIKG